MTKTEAAEFLGVSPRAVERYVAAGRLPAKYERSKNGRMMVVEPADVERLKAELDTPVERAAPIPDSRSLAIPGGTWRRNITAGDLLAMLRIDGSPAAPRPRPEAPVEAKLLLSLAECQALTGLSRGILRGAMETGGLQAKRIGRSWRVKRTDLDSYVEAL